MRINAVSSYSTMKQRKLRETTTPITTPVETTPQAPTGMAMISFKSGNKSQVMMLGVEENIALEEACQLEHDISHDTYLKLKNFIEKVKK